MGSDVEYLGDVEWRMRILPSEGTPPESSLYCFRCGCQSLQEVTSKVSVEVAKKLNGYRLSRMDNGTEILQKWSSYKVA